jgi:hypothetical protein
VRDQGLSKQIADLVRRLDVLGGELAARHEEHPLLSEVEGPGYADAEAQVLITHLSGLVDRLERNIGRLKPLQHAGEPHARPHDATAVIPSALLPKCNGTEMDVSCSAAGLGNRRASVASVLGPHGVHFSRSHDHTVAAIIDMFDDARANGRAVVVVATALHRRWIEADLHQRCIAFEGDVCRLLDADATLSSILVDGQPDRDRFRSIVGTLVSDVCARNPRGVSVYGEMVGLLWSRGHAAGSLRLEELWNELRHELPFSLLCGYSIDGCPDTADLDPIRSAHTYVG